MTSLVVSCEHASAAIPPAYAHLFTSARARALLASHRGSDLGALRVARAVAEHFDARLLAGGVSRLLVDLNRSPTHPRLFSEFSRALGADARAELVETYHEPHRRNVEEAVKRLAAREVPVLHLSVHSFTPKLDGKIRRTDIGLLYDPSRPTERALCAAWKHALATEAPGLRIHLNRPYRGTTDGLTTSLRGKFGARSYLGVEVELNQAGWTGVRDHRPRIAHLLAVTLAQAGEIRTGRGAN